MGFCEVLNIKHFVHHKGGSADLIIILSPCVRVIHSKITRTLYLGPRRPEDDEEAVEYTQAAYG